jgi:hypothetical protein
LRVTGKPLWAETLWVLAAAALWLATYKEYGMLMRLANAAGATIVGVKGAARRMRA